ncbi:Uncharacterised protein [Mycobacteroides abscessus subsp. abscessus]|uniref:hypothetical protein n=1 Tax=Mycobacteroides abscessus TaxID=36809 RepID=UPI000925A162|nr:hypothetical protein [Mycobacteroides abscessus]SIH35729.1 Uncharacterised protein [Mycobacteroides abscessus subsp. abscessus]
MVVVFGRREFVTEVDGVQLTKVHPMDQCIGLPCVIHSPTPHHMRCWPLQFRSDKRVFDRQCPHGQWHPDPDQFAYWKVSGQLALITHICDDCCRVQ